jgi:hypothetical protein
MNDSPQNPLAEILRGLARDRSRIVEAQITAVGNAAFTADRLLRATDKRIDKILKLAP